VTLLYRNDETTASQVGLSWYVANEARPYETIAMAWLAGFSSPRTRESYELGIRQWFIWLSDIGIDPLQVVRAHVELWQRQLEAIPLADRTIALRLTTVTSFYAYCVEEDILTKNPTRGIHRPKIQRRSPTAWLTRPQLADLLEAGREVGPTAYALLMLLSLNGLRIAEACSLDVDALQWRGFYPVVSFTRKGGDVAEAALARPTEAAIVAAINERTTGPLFLTSYSTRMNQKAAQRLIDLCISSVRGQHGRITPHALRHSWCTVAMQSGCNPEQIRHDGGWSDGRMVSYYSHGFDDPARSTTHTVSGLILSS
jgi:integrase/recombinase XerD